MKKIITLDDDLVDLLVEIITDHRSDVEDGSIIYEDKGEALHNLGEILSVLRNPDSH